MARASAVAFLVVILSMGLLAQAQTESPASPSRSSTRLQRPKQVSSPRWTAGYSLWTESLRLLRADGRAFDVASSARAFSFGYQWDWMQRRKGWFVEPQAHFGEATTMSRSPDLTYFQKSSPLMGASFTAIYHWNFETPRLFVGLGAASLWRQVSYEVPDGYSFQRDQEKLIHHLKVDLSFPVGRGFEVIQQFGVPVEGNGHFWQIGLRRL